VTMMDRVQALLAECLTAWRVSGEVRRDGDAVLLAACGEVLRVEPAAPGLPFRYTLTRDGRARHATSVVGLLRTVRGVIDPGYQPVRLRVAPTPPAPS
jgi:hypothetical protein